MLRPPLPSPLWLLSAAVLALSACPAPGPLPHDAGPGPDPVLPVDPPAPGATSFLSADGYSGQEANRDVAPGAPESDANADAGGDSGERSVVEGDIYRVLGNGLLANLNAYRGLQLIDFSDPSAPAIVGRLPVTGTPVEMYVHEGIAYLLLNDWRGYGGSRFASQVSTWTGGIALAVDISDPAAPTILDRARIPGHVSKSRLVHGASSASLYVVTGGYDQWQNADGSWAWESRTVVQSFDVSGGTLTEKTQLNLGGYVADIQATPQALLVARNDWSSGENLTQVSVVDISDPAGTMVEGGQVAVAGYVSNQFNLDLYNGVLRVVSGSRWGSEPTNHIETFDASDIHNLTRIDHKTFGDNEDLYATLFLGNKAFFVTYFRTDPFHAFEISDEGIATERSEFIVSGWNDFFRPVLGQERLIGIGVNDEQGRTMAVSLYDITDLSNPRPLLKRAEVAADSSWSEASYDHRAFSVIENAVSVAAGDVTETGLILLPFSGWNDEWSTYTSGVQIFTFSESTLTRRGLMNHGTQVRRSFLADSDVTANLSEAELSLFDATAPDAPAELGRLELAPNYTDVFPLDNGYAVRVKNSSEYYWGWWGGNAELPPARAEIIRRTGDVDANPALATLEIPANASAHLVGHLFVTLEPVWIEDAAGARNEGRAVIYDLSDPTVPVETATLQDAGLLAQSGYGYPGVADCFRCGGWYGYANVEAYALPDALVLPSRTWQQAEVGWERACYRSPDEPSRCDASGTTCTRYIGSETCTSLDGRPESCVGEIQECTYTESRGEQTGESPDRDAEEASGEVTVTCEPVDSATLRMQEQCYEGPRYRYWNRYELRVLHLQDPSAPTLSPALELPLEQDGVGIVEAGESLWLTTREPVLLEDDPRPYQRYFAHQLRVSEGVATLDDGVNIPGTLIAVEGNTLFTRDLLWGEHAAETWVHRLRLQEGVAELLSSRSFAAREVAEVRLDGAGHLLVSHREPYFYGPPVAVDVAEAGDAVSSASSSSGSEYQQLAILDAQGDLNLLAEVDVDLWATLQDAREGRALFQVPGGLLVMNVRDAAQPYPQAYFPTLGWPRKLVVEGQDAMFAAGRYGLYRFDLGTFNLLAPELF